MCGFRKYPYPPQGWSLEILGGGGEEGSQYPEFLKGSMELNWKFQGGQGWEGTNQRTILEEGMDIFLEPDNRVTNLINNF